MCITGAGRGLEVSTIKEVFPTVTRVQSYRFRIGGKLRVKFFSYGILNPELPTDVQVFLGSHKSFKDLDYR